jgi:hypothetical protein
VSWWTGAVGGRPLFQRLELIGAASVSAPMPKIVDLDADRGSNLDAD